MKKSKILISVVIPTKDEGPNTKETINEVKKYLKKYKTEFLIASGDKTSSWSINYPFYNAADAILYAAGQARGDYILLTDADHTYPADMVPEMMKLMRSGKYLLVSSSRRGRIAKGAHALPNFLANSIISFLIRFFSKYLVMIQRQDFVFMMDHFSKHFQQETICRFGLIQFCGLKKNIVR